MERFDSRGNPQTPCPLVHPLASFVPNPTKNPLIANPRKERSLIYEDEAGIIYKNS